jgi:hypothetical protein
MQQNFCDNNASTYLRSYQPFESDTYMRSYLTTTAFSRITRQFEENKLPENHCEEEDLSNAPLDGMPMAEKMTMRNIAEEGRRILLKRAALALS